MYYLSTIKTLIKKQCKKWLSSKRCHFVKKYFYGIKLLHAKVQCVFIGYKKYQDVSAKLWNKLHSPNMHCLCTIKNYKGQYRQQNSISRAAGYKNPVSLSKDIFSASNFFMRYHPLSTMCSCRKMAKLKTLSVCQKNIFSASNFFMHIYNISEEYWKRSNENSKRS